MSTPTPEQFAEAIFCSGYSPDKPCERGCPCDDHYASVLELISRPTLPSLTREKVARIIRQNCRASEVGNDEVTGSYAAADAILSLLPAEAERAAAENVSAAIERAREEENEACEKAIDGISWIGAEGVHTLMTAAKVIRSRRGAKT